MASSEQTLPPLSVGTPEPLGHCENPTTENVFTKRKLNPHHDFHVGGVGESCISQCIYIYIYIVYVCVCSHVDHINSQHCSAMPPACFGMRVDRYNNLGVHRPTEPSALVWLGKTSWSIFARTSRALAVACPKRDMPCYRFFFHKLSFTMFHLYSKCLCTVASFLKLFIITHTRASVCHISGTKGKAWKMPKRRPKSPEKAWSSPCSVPRIFYRWRWVNQ